MNVEMLEDLRTHEPEVMDEVARALGDHLAVTPDRNLRSLRTALKRSTGPGDDGFAIGFVRALEMVLRGFEARREADDEDAAAVEIASHNPCRAALELIAERHAVLPTALAKDLKLKPNHVTAVLKKLTAAGLVTGHDADDGRMRPRSITPYGRVILQKSNASASTGPIDGVVKGVVHAMAQLEDGRASRIKLAGVFDECLDARRAKTALTAFRDAMAAAYTGFFDGDDSFLVPGISVRRELMEQLRDAKLKDDVPLVKRLRALSEHRQLVVRVSSGDDDWDHMVSRRSLLRVVVVRDDELTNVRFRTLVESPFDVLYPSAGILISDSGCSDAGVLAKASTRYLLGDPSLSALAKTMHLPPGTKVLPIEPW